MVVGGIEGGHGDGGAGGSVPPSKTHASGIGEEGEGQEAPFLVGGGSDSEDEAPILVPEDDPDDPWLVPGLGFNLQLLTEWLSVDEAPWLAEGKLSRREVVMGVLALQQKYHLSNGVAEAFMGFIDSVAGDAASARLPETWKEVERLLEGLIISAEKWYAPMQALPDAGKQAAETYKLIKAEIGKDKRVR